MKKHTAFPQSLPYGTAKVFCIAKVGKQYQIKNAGNGKAGEKEKTRLMTADSWQNRGGLIIITP
jgi:hypothetical protein